MQRTSHTLQFTYKRCFNHQQFLEGEKLPQSHFYFNTDIEKPSWLEAYCLNLNFRSVEGLHFSKNLRN